MRKSRKNKQNYKKERIHSFSVSKRRGKGHFDVGWIAVVRKNLYTNQCSKLEGALSLLMYIKENYDEITNTSYCRDSDILIDEFIDNISKKMI